MPRISKTNLRNLKEVEMASKAYSEIRKLCPNCGHSLFFFKVDKCICDHCGYYVFKDKKTEFMYRMKEKSIKQKREEIENDNKRKK